MSARTALMARAPEHESESRGLAQAREVLRPELLAGVSGAPLEWARRFHRSFFDEAHDAISDRCVLVLPDVVIGRPDPLLCEIQRWGAACEPEDLTELSSADIARDFSCPPGVERRICTAADVFLPAFQSCPHLDDVELSRSITASLCISTTLMLRGVAPHVRVGHAVVVAYRPSSVFRTLARAG